MPIIVLTLSVGQPTSGMSPIALLTDQPDEIIEDAHETDDSAGGPGTKGTSGAPKYQQQRHKGGSVQRHDGRVLATPAAKVRARELAVDLGSLVASRPDGLITRRDVNSAVTALRPAHPMAAITIKSVQVIPHFYITADADLGAALAWREGWNSEHPDSRLTLNDVFVRAGFSRSAGRARDECLLLERYD
jgi:pyruvate/2-oxoglutarate dehydrogenase complex dihydrolipoamide acyltransferase (E2) component